MYGMWWGFFLNMLTPILWMYMYVCLLKLWTYYNQQRFFYTPMATIRLVLFREQGRLPVLIYLTKIKLHVYILHSLFLAVQWPVLQPFNNLLTTFYFDLALLTIQCNYFCSASILITAKPKGAYHTLHIFTVLVCPTFSNISAVCP